MRNLRSTKGFTLIELMIVVVIIGILAAIAIPKFSNVSRSAKQSEAESILKQVHSLQESYRQKTDWFSGNITTPATTTSNNTGYLTGWDNPNAKYFTFTVTATQTSYCAVATPNADGTAAGLVAMNITVANAAAPAVTDGRPAVGGTCGAAPAPAGA